MIISIIALSGIIYFLSVGFWSTLLIIASDSIKDELVKWMLVGMFVPGFNTCWAFFIIVGVWANLVKDKTQN